MKPAPSLEQRKAQLEEELKNTEKQILEMEENYIAQTHHYGNVIKGWDGFSNPRPRPGSHAARKPKIAPKDRLFSSSSTTSPTKNDDDTV